MVLGYLNIVDRFIIFALFNFNIVDTFRWHVENADIIT